MDDLLSLGRWGDDSSLARASIVRDVVYASADTNRFANLFFSLRWAVLLGVLPLPLSRWSAESDRLQARWQEASRAVLHSSGGAGDEVDTAAPAPVPPRRTRFDESSSSSSDTEEVKPVRTASGTNPLRPAAGTRYAHEFHVNAQRREIRKDLDRLFWDVPPLAEDGVQSKADIEKLVLCYCVQHQRDYRQGLHEVAAFLYCACVTDHERAAQAARTLTTPMPSSCATLDAVLAVLHTKDCAVALAYALFERLLGTDGVHLESWFYVTGDADQAHGIVAASAHVQSELLRAVDPALEHQLGAVYEIQSATYLIRWLRLLFLREFSLSQSMLVWTVLFADFSARCAATGDASSYTLDNSLVVFVAVAMLEHIEDVLRLSADTALRALMRYPPQTEVLTILRGAAALACLPELSQALAPPTPPARAPPAHAPRAPLPPSPPAEVLPMVERQGRELSAIIQSLEAYWFPSAQEEKGEEDKDTPSHRQAQETAYAEAIARLKKVRDVLLYGVDE